MTDKGVPYSFRDGVYTFPGSCCQLLLSDVRRNRHGGIDVLGQFWTLDGSACLGIERGDMYQDRFRNSLVGQSTRRNSGDPFQYEELLLAALIALKDDPNVVEILAPPAFQPVEQFLKGVHPPGAEVVSGLLERGCLYAISSRPKVGKTLMLLNLAVAVAKGHDWLERKVVAGPVYFLQLEDSDRTLKRRLERMTGTNWPLNLMIHVAPFRLCLENYDSTLRAVKGASLIICDPIIQATHVMDWNSQAEVRAAYELWRQLARDSDAAVCVSNHHRKMEGDYGDQMAGSIQALATVDGVIEMFRDRRLDKIERKITFTGRDWSDRPDEVIVLDTERLMWLYKGDLAEVRETDKEEKREEKRQEDAQRALAVLPDGPPGLTWADWRQQTGFNDKRLRDARKILGEGISWEGKGGRGGPRRFWRPSD